MQKVSETKSNTIVSTRQKISILEKLSFAWTILSVLFSTGFVIFAILTQWGATQYSYILLGIICLYIVVFASIIAIRAARGKKKQNLLMLEAQSENEGKASALLQKENSKRLKRTKKMLKDYKSGINILKAMTNFLFIVMTIILMCSAVSMRGTNSLIAWASVSVSLLLSLLSLTFKIATFAVKKTLPYIAKKGTYSLYEVIDGKVKEKTRTNKMIQKFKNKLIDDDK
ncbi:MAG: hypothetical protein PHE93_04450 [Clostridia bacterium]|nr:hypothetical protein [Clostridia bacterium]